MLEALRMSGNRRSQRKSHIVAERPPFERIALLLQGGGALGSYQAGVYQALAEANLHPDWVAGISIGAINSALIAGNSPDKRVERLREFWEAITTPPFGMPDMEWLQLKRQVCARRGSIKRAHWARCWVVTRFLQTARAAALFTAERHTGGDQLLRCHPSASYARTPGGF